MSPNLTERAVQASRRGAEQPAWLKKIPPGSPEKDYVQHAPAWMQDYMHKHRIPSDPDLHAAKMLSNKEMQAIVLDQMGTILTSPSLAEATKRYKEAEDFFSALVHYRMGVQREGGEPGQGATDAMRRGHALWSAVNQAVQFVSKMKKEGPEALYPWMRKGLKAMGWDGRGERAKKAELTAMEHPSERDKREYLRRHPNADPRKHTVAPHDSPNRDRVQDEPHTSSPESIHDSHAPASVKKFVDMKLPQVTHDNAARVMKDPRVQSVVTEASKMSDDELGKARADAAKYLESLDKRSKDIGAAGGKSSGFEKARAQAHAVVYVLNQVAAQRGGAKKASLREDPLATPLTEAAQKQARTPQEWAQFDQNRAEILEYFRHLRWDVREDPAHRTQLTAPNQQFRAWILVNGDVNWKYGPELSYGPNTMLLHDFNVDGGSGEKLYKMLKKSLGVAQGMRMVRIAQDPLTALQQLAKFEEGKPADPTKDMSEEDAKEWRRQHELHEDEFKTAKFEGGKPADPTKDMSEEDARTWHEMHDKYKDVVKDRTADQGFNLKPLGQMADLGAGLAEPFRNLHSAFEATAKNLLQSSTPSDKKLAEIARRTEAALVEAIHASDKLKRAVRDPAHRIAGVGGALAALRRLCRFEEDKAADPTKNMSEEDAKEWEKQNEEHKDEFKAAASIVAKVSPKSPVGTRVVVNANPASRALYDHLPPDGSEGSVQAVAMPGGKKTYLPGPGGGLLYVSFDNGEFMGVAPIDLDKAAASKAASSDAGSPIQARGSAPEIRAFRRRCARFEAGKPADPTKHMSEEDADKWREMHSKYKDKFKAAGAQGLYGYDPAVQSDCEQAARHLYRRATLIARRAHAADPQVGAFLAERASRRSCEASKILADALGPADTSAPRHPQGGMYGLPSRTATVGLRACAELEVAAGTIAAALYSRRQGAQDQLASFFRDHSRRARCARSRLLAACAPALD